MDASNSAIRSDQADEDEDEQQGQDMDQALAKYYIATSHNTYLAGHQLKGLSSVQLYREVGTITMIKS